MEDILKKYHNAISSNNPDQVIDEIADILEYSTISRETVRVLVNQLIEHVIKEDNYLLKESLFNAITNAVIYQNIGEAIQWDCLVDNISKMDERFLEYVFICLGFSHKEKYIPLLENYLSHFNQEIVLRAEESLKEIRHNINN